MKDKTQRIFDYLRNKDRRVSLKINGAMWDLFSELAGKENKSNTAKIEELIIHYFEEKGVI